MKLYCRAALAIATACLILEHSTVAVSQTGGTEYQVKAAFLYNFAKFVDWPPQAFSGGGSSAFTICVIGDPFKGALDKIIQGEVLDRRPLMLRHITAGEDLRGCQIMYIGPAEVRRTTQIINAVGDAPILTVGETDDFINDGGIIRFVKSGDRIHFQINPDAAERASLTISARLLRLAEIVRPRRRAELIR